MRYQATLALVLLTVVAGCSTTTIQEVSNLQFDPPLQSASPDNVELAKRAHESFSGDQPSNGWRQLSGAEIRTLVIDHAFRVDYLDLDETFEYAFAGSNVTRQRIEGGVGADRPEQGTWIVTGDMLCATWNVKLCWKYYSDGGVTMARREYDHRYWGEVYGPASKVILK